MNKWQPQKPVQLCIRVPDVDAWYQWCAQCGVDALSDMFENAALGIRAFVFRDRRLSGGNPDTHTGGRMSLVVINPNSANPYRRDRARLDPPAGWHRADPVPDA